MRLIIQIVKQAKVYIQKLCFSKIDRGLLTFIGIEKNDTTKEIHYCLNKLINLKIFKQNENYMKYSIMDIKADLLIVSQFTLYGDCRKGYNPSFSQAMKSDKAKKIYNNFVTEAKKFELRVETGKFQSIMELEYINEGPSTFLIDSNKQF